MSFYKHKHLVMVSPLDGIGIEFALLHFLKVPGDDELASRGDNGLFQLLVTSVELGCSKVERSIKILRVLGTEGQSFRPRLGGCGEGSIDCMYSSITNITCIVDSEYAHPTCPS